MLLQNIEFYHPDMERVYFFTHVILVEGAFQGIISLSFHGFQGIRQPSRTVSYASTVRMCYAVVIFSKKKPRKN